MSDVASAQATVRMLDLLSVPFNERYESPTMADTTDAAPRELGGVWIAPGGE